MGENAYFKKRGFTPLVTTPKHGINCIRRESGESRPTCVPHAHFHQVESVGRPGAQGRHSLVIVISEWLVNISMQLHWSPSQTRYLMFSEMFSERPVRQCQFFKILFHFVFRAGSDSVEAGRQQLHSAHILKSLRYGDFMQ